MRLIASARNILATHSLLRRAIRPWAIPLYRAAELARFQYVARRDGWSFPANHSASHAFAFGTWEPETTRLIHSLLFDGATFVDVGANVGYYTRLAARRVGRTGRVFAFEPSPENFACLVHNTRRLPNVTPVASAVSDRTGRVLPLFVGSVSGLHSLFRESAEAPATAWTLVPTMALDDFIDSAGLDHIDLVKIDAEGAEPLVLRGMGRALDAGKVGAMVLEYSPESVTAGGMDPFELGAVLTARFRLRVIEERKAPLFHGPLHTSEAFAELASAMTHGVVNLLCVPRTPRTA